MSYGRRRPAPQAIVVSVLATIAMWWSPSHIVFSVGLMLVLGVPLWRAGGTFAAGESRRELIPPLVALAAAALHGAFPQSAAVAIASLAIIGGALPAHLVFEALRARVSTQEFLVLLLAQPGFALAVHILGPQTVMLDHATRGALAAWFVVTAVAQTGLSLVRLEPLRAVFAIGLSQTTLLIAGAIVSEHGFAAEYSMLFGTNLGLASLVLVLADLRVRYGVTRLAPDNGLADGEAPLARLFLVLGWFFAGLPGGIVFFAEDLLFHALVEHSTWTAAGMIFASVLNGVAFYRVYLGMFSGRMRPGLAASGTPAPLLVLGLRGITLVTLFFGLFPQLLLVSA